MNAGSNRQGVSRTDNAFVWSGDRAHDFSVESWLAVQVIDVLALPDVATLATEAK